MKKILVYILFFTMAINLSAQQERVDSLYKEYSKATVDTTKINLMFDIHKAYLKMKSVKGLGYVREALELSERLGYNRGICLGNGMLGDYFYDQLRYSEAIKHYLKAIKAGEKEKMYTTVSVINNKIGIIYSNQKKSELSMKYFERVAELAEIQKLPKRKAIAYNNIGIAYKNMGRYAEARKYYDKALEEFKKSDFKVGIASVYNGLGILSHLQKDDESALNFYNMAMENFRAINDTASESGILTNIGEVYNDRGDYKKALDCYTRSLYVAEKYKDDEHRVDAYDGLSEVHANMKNYEKAFYYKNRYLGLKDTMSDEEGMRQIQEMEKRLENEKQEKEIELLTQRQEIQDLKVKSQSEKLKKSNIIIFSVAGILLVVLAMSFFIFKAYKQIKKTNHELAEKKKEIQDSINYAKKIQNAMLPDVNILSKHFPRGGFGLFMPKDVVSGDFYWFGEINDTVYLAAADCTGHGVPGAFMSMIGIDKLNSLMDKKVEFVPQILSLLNISIKKALKQTKAGTSSRDGMDIALCSLNSKTRILNYAGANRPLWILRNGEIIEYKPTKASIGGFVEDHQEYVGHKIKMEEDDIVYIFSDGFADQFGGPDKKKFMSKQMRKTLIEIHKIPMREQELVLQKKFNDWKGPLEQVDDVLVLAFKV